MSYIEDNPDVHSKILDELEYLGLTRGIKDYSPGDNKYYE